MNQNIWGPHLWFSLHTMSFVYPLTPSNEDKNNYKRFFLSLENVIPCAVCKKNYIRHLKEHPIDNYLNNRKDLVYWVIDMHNLVNGEIGKKIFSYDTVLKKYENVFKKNIVLNTTDDISTYISTDMSTDMFDNKSSKINIKNIVYIFILILFAILLINLAYHLKIFNNVF